MGICKFSGNSNTYHGESDSEEPYDLSYDLKKAVVVIFIDSSCQKCKKVQDLLASVHVNPSIVDISSSSNQKGLKKALKQFISSNSPPHVFIASKYFGGLNEVEKGVKDHSVQKLINSRLESIGSRMANS